jgi:dolichol-phosphate mannosyltransferase
MRSGSTLVIIPTFEEAENIETVLRRVRCAAPTADVLVVDDNSSDGTAMLADELAEELGQIHVLRRKHKEGLGSAYRTAFGYGIVRGYDVLVEMDADLSHDPATLPALIEEAERGADLVIGSRYIPGGATPAWKLRRRALSRLGNKYAAFALGLDASDVTSGFRAFRADALRRVGFETTHATGYAFQIELAYRVAQADGRIAQVPIVFNDRTLGHSKMSSFITIEALWLVTWWAIRDRVFGRGRRSGTSHRGWGDARRGTPVRVGVG